MTPNDAPSPAPNVATDYYGFTLTATAGNTLNLSSLVFDMVGAVSNINNGLNSSAQVFYALNGSTTFTAIGAPVTSTVVGNATNETKFGAVTTGNVNLSSLTGVNSVEIRLAMFDNSTSNSKATFVQGITLNGVAVPEPSSSALAALAGLALLVRRRR